MINSKLRAGYYVLVVEIPVHAHNADRVRGEPRDELYHRVCPSDVVVNGRLIGKHELRNTLADDGDVLCIPAIGFVEITSRNNGDAERGEISRPYGAKERAVISFPGVG